LGSYGPFVEALAAAICDADVTAGVVAAVGGAMAAVDVGAGIVAAVLPIVLALGYVACGALAIVPDDVGGIALPGSDAVPAAARLADDGGDAGCNSAGEMACGVDCADGKAGAAERAVSDVSSDALSRFHHVRRGPD
jgi:hypothetical protein